MSHSPNSFTLPTLSPYKKRKLIKIAELLLKSQQIMQQKKNHILHYTLGADEKHIRMQHYPKGDRIDFDTGAQYFYHCHREDYEKEEHGHFHCFLRYKHIPKHIKPHKLPDWDKYIDNPMTHIIAISMDRYGQPIRLFTVNRWVTSEIWYNAINTPKLIKRYQMTKNDDAYWQVTDKWVEGMIHLFAPQITWLNDVRDQYMQQQVLLDPHKNFYNDETIEEISSIPINIHHQVEWLLTS